MLRLIPNLILSPWAQLVQDMTKDEDLSKHATVFFVDFLHKHYGC